MAPIAATMIGGSLEGCGPSQPLPPVNWHHLHGADGADALQGIGQQWPRSRHSWSPANAEGRPENHPLFFKCYTPVTRMS